MRLLTRPDLLRQAAGAAVLVSGSPVSVSSAAQMYSRPGQLNPVWPTVARSVDTVHFASAYTDDLRWGMVAACVSALRAVEALERA